MILAIVLSLAAPTAPAATWYVRPDGGTAEQCTGRVDAAYPGAGEDRDCAFAHPFVALPPGGAARIAGGDTLVVARGSYMMGLGAPGADACRREWSWDCHMPAIPSGPTPARPTRIVGAGFDSGCPVPPELWGTERAARIVDLTGSANVVLACFEITDHAACIEHHCAGGRCAGEVARCNREQAPFGRWAPVGIHATASRNVTLRDLDIHGLANRGIHAGGLRDWTVERVKIRANGWSGWDGDVGEASANAGTMRFRDVEIAWNGCAERWPHATPFACWAQSAGGYGDGLGTARTGGHWVFEDSSFHHNTSDGIDLLYLDETGSATFRRVHAASNAGNQVKVSGSMLLADSVLVGDCRAHARERNLGDGDHCRAMGNTLSLVLGAGARARVARSIVQGEGDCTVLASCADGGCAGASLEIAGNRLEALQRRPDDDGTTCALYLQPRWSDISVALRGNVLVGARTGLACLLPGVDCSDNEDREGVVAPARGLAALPARDRP